MARGRTRVSSYGRGQMQKGIAASQEFGSGFSKLAGGVADIVKGVASAGSQAASAAERSFNRPRVTPVTTSAPGSLSAASATKPTVSAAPTASTPGDKSATTTSAAKPAAAPKTTTASTTKPAAPVAGKSLQSRISSLASSNKIANVNKIYAGKTMDVGGSKYTIQKGDTLTSIAKKFPGQSQTTTATEPPEKISPSQYNKEREMAKQNMTAPAPKSVNKPEVSSALQDRIRPENLGSNPANLVNKDVTKGRETNNRSDTPQTKGSVTTAPEPAKPSSASGADKQWNERPKYDYSKAGGGKGGTPINESTVNVGGNKYRIV